MLAEFFQFVASRRAFLNASLQILIPSILFAGGQPAVIASSPNPQPGDKAKTAAARATLNAVEAKVSDTVVITFTASVTRIDFGGAPGAPEQIVFTRQRLYPDRPDFRGQFLVRFVRSGKVLSTIVVSQEGGYVYNSVSNRYCKIQSADEMGLMLEKVLVASKPVLSTEEMEGFSWLWIYFGWGNHPFSIEALIDGDHPTQLRSYPGLLNGQPIDHIIQAINYTGKLEMAADVYADRQTNLPARYELRADHHGKMFVRRINFSDFELSNTPLPDSTFQFIPPGAAAETQPVSRKEAQEPAILAAGEMAPNFAVQTISGKTVHLADFAGKIVVLDFWSVWGDPNKTSLLAMEKRAKIYRGKNIVFLPVCPLEEKSSFPLWVNHHKNWTIPFYFDPDGYSESISSDLYQVSESPTQFIIGKNGKVIDSFTGYDAAKDDKRLDAAIKKGMNGA